MPSMIGFLDVVVPRRIIYPENFTYRMWRHFIVFISFYLCSYGIFQLVFVARQQIYVIIVHSIVVGCLLVDIFLLFFVAYIDKKKLLVIDDPRKIAIRNAHPIRLLWRLSLIIPVEIIGMNFQPSSMPYRILTGFGLLRVFHIGKVRSLFPELELNENINYIKVRLARMILDCLFDCHVGGCLFFYIATLHGNSEGTWFALADPNFQELGLTEKYFNSIYWAVSSFRTVGFGNLHAVTILEKIFSVFFLLFNVVLAAYLIANIIFLIAPEVDPAGKYIARRRRVASFCRQNNLPTQFQNEVFAHLKLEYLSCSIPSEKHDIFDSLPTAMKVKVVAFLYNKVANNYLFAWISNIVRFQLVQVMEPVLCAADTSVILQYEQPECFYFVLRGSLDFVLARNGVQHVVRTVQAGDVFGEICVLFNKPQLFSVVTRETTQLLRLSRARLLNILEGNHDDGSIILNNLIQILRELNDQYLNNVLKEFKEKAVTGRIDLPVSLWFAIDGGYHLLFSRLAAQHPYGPDPNGCDAGGRTALHMAASLGDWTKVDQLCRMGADIHIKDMNGNIPLWNAMVGKHEDVVQYLIDRGANLGSCNVGKYACFAVERNDFDLLQSIATRGGSVTAADQENGNTALHAAVYCNNIEIVNYLLSHNARIDTCNRIGLTPIHVADMHNCTDIQAIFRN